MHPLRRYRLDGVLELGGARPGGPSAWLLAGRSRQNGISGSVDGSSSTPSRVAGAANTTAEAADSGDAGLGSGTGSAKGSMKMVSACTEAFRAGWAPSQPTGELHDAPAAGDLSALCGQALTPWIRHPRRGQPVTTGSAPTRQPPTPLIEVFIARFRLSCSVPVPWKWDTPRGTAQGRRRAVIFRPRTEPKTKSHPGRTRLTFGTVRPWLRDMPRVPRSPGSGPGR